MSIPPEMDVFRKDVGTFDVDVEVRMGPGDPQLSKGVATGKLISGGRWLVVSFRNETTNFEGQGTYGWDSTKGCYTSLWVDDMRPFMIVGQGTWDAASRTMTWLTDCPSPQGTMRVRECMQVKDEGTQVLRIFMPTPQGEHEMMTATYRRRG